MSAAAPLDSRVTPPDARPMEKSMSALPPRCPTCGGVLSLRLSSTGDCPGCMLRRAFAPPSVAARPDDFGDYEVGEEIGRGGMGVVYRARQRALDREIALKLLPFELLESDDFLERFEREARLMARLTHPGIARVFEAGISRNGQAYLALELIAGQPLDDHLRVEDPPLPARLALFLQVAEAVQHAHERGIVHRDLKPSNVLVSAADGGSTAKVIDFGLARPSGDAGADAAIWRSQPAMVGTPLYISPEQAAGEEVDTRTDVYALGALLYEMLAGRPPFDEHDFRDASRAEVLRVLRGQEPPPPSARTAVRRIDPDLDAICRRALARAPDERYATVAALADDVRRFLALQPITARVPTHGYRAGLFVRRHRLALALASVFVLGLLSAAAFSLQQARQARLERDRAEKVKSFLFAVLNSPAPGVGGREVRVVEVLSAARERAEQELADDPATRWEVLLTLGTTYYELSQYTEAEPLLQAALRDAERAFGSESVPAGRVRKALGDLYNFSSRQPAAAEFLQRAVAIFRRHLPSAHEHLMLALHALASVSIHRGEQRAAIPALEESLALAQRSDTLAARLHRVVVLGDLAPCYEAVGRQAEGRALTEQAVRAARQYPQLQENLATLLSNSAEDLAEVGDCAGAAAAAEESYRLRSALHGARSQSAGIGQARLAQMQRHCGDFATAERNAREALAILRSVSAPQARELFHPLRALGLTLLEAGRPAEAEPVLTELVAVLELRQPQSPLLTTAREALARARATAAP